MALRQEDGRPDPEALLARWKSDEPTNRGKLKIFLGYAAGVGKTYAMLQAARRQLADQADVVVGIVETHGRPETEALLRDLPLLPRLRVRHREIEVEEFDLDGCLARKPELVLVDELAHTNPEGSRHRKRYQDVQELLLAGIDVYTTLNIQHLESLNDTVHQITGVRVRETLPDTVVDEADAIALVDLPPDELLLRLRSGHVYQGAKAETAQNHFFRPGNLTALREMALRTAAERVDDDVRSYMQKRAIAGPWPVKERLLVAVGPSPLSERLVRATRRLADALGAEWWAVSVRSSSSLTAEAANRVSRHLQLAESLGAGTRVVQGPSIPETLIRFAREHNVTKVVAGKPLGKTWFWQKDMVDRLIRVSGNIDVFVVSAEAPVRARRRPATWFREPGRYAQAVLATGLVTLLIFPIRGLLVPTNLVMVYLLSVCALAYRLGRGPSALASALSVALFDFLFVPPYYTFAVSDREYVLTFAGLLGVALAISYLTAHAREQAEAARRHEAETATLYSLSRSLSATQGTQAIGEVVAERLAEHLRRSVRYLSAQPTEWPTLPAAHRAVAVWASEHSRPAGKGTDTLTESDILCRPLLGQNGLALGSLLLELQEPLSPDDKQLLETFAGQAELALERAHLAQVAREAELLRTSDQLQTTLLNSISHDLRIPLVSIQGALQSLQDEENEALEPSARAELLQNAVGETERLNRIVANLLQMNRLEAGHVAVNLQPQELDEVIHSTVAQLRCADRVRLQLAPGLPLVQADFLLLQQVFVNLLDNAFKFAPGTPVEIGTGPAGEAVEAWVRDEGPGIPENQHAHVFEPFYRGKSETTGSGLGLSICRGLMEAMQGSISIENAQPGTLFRLRLKAVRA